MTTVQTIRKTVCCGSCKESSGIFIHRTPIVLLCPAHAALGDLLEAAAEVENVINPANVDRCQQISLEKLAKIIKEIRGYL